MLDTLNYVLSKDQSNKKALRLKIQTYDLMGEDDLCQQNINEYIKFDTLNAEAIILKPFILKTLIMQSNFLI